MAEVNGASMPSSTIATPDLPKASSTTTTTTTSSNKGNLWGSLVNSVQKGVEKKRQDMKVAKEAREAGKIWKGSAWECYLLDEEFEKLELEQQKQ